MQRYQPFILSDGKAPSFERYQGMMPIESGEWVKWTDVADLQAQLAQKDATIKQLSEWATKEIKRAEQAEASLALQDAQQRVIEEWRAWRSVAPEQTRWDMGYETALNGCADQLAALTDLPRPSEKGQCPECTGVPDGAFTKGYCERCGTTKRKPLVPRPSAPQE